MYIFYKKHQDFVRKWPISVHKKHTKYKELVRDIEAEILVQNKKLKVDINVYIL